MQVFFESLVAGAQAHVVVCQAFRVNFEAGVLAGDLIKLGLKLLNLGPEGANAIVSVLLDLIYANDRSLELLSFLKERFVHLLHLVALHHELLFQRSILLQLEL